MVVCDFVNLHFYPKRNRHEPRFPNLQDHLEGMLQIRKIILVDDSCMKELCHNLADWINSNYRWVPPHTV